MAASGDEERWEASTSPRPEHSRRLGVAGPLGADAEGSYSHPGCPAAQTDPCPHHHSEEAARGVTPSPVTTVPLATGKPEENGAADPVPERGAGQRVDLRWQ